MDDTSPEQLTVSCGPAVRKGKCTITARLGEEVLEVETLDLTKSKEREDFIKVVCGKRPGIDQEVLRSHLLQLAAEVGNTQDCADSTSKDATELDAGRLARPERIIVPEVSGVMVPIMTTVGEHPVCVLRQYLRWADGRREYRPLGRKLDLPDGKALWIHPTPADPTPATRCQWSRPSREAWLQGSPAPAPADLYCQLCEQIARFIDLPATHGPGIVATLGLWVILSYVYLAWDAVPYLYIGGPLGSGKSRVFEVLARLVFRPFVSSNLTSATMFRTLHSQGGVLLLDEAERLKQAQCPDVQDILSMLLAGYKRGGSATRLEPVGDTFKAIEFDVFGPKAMASIAGLPPALSSRTITVAMFRAAPGSDKTRRRIDAEPESWQRLRDDLHTLVLEHGSIWLELPKQVEVCPEMTGRDFELWQPLLALARWFESHGVEGLLGLMQEHAQDSIDAGKDDQTPDTEESLLRIMANAVRNEKRLSAKGVLDEAKRIAPDDFKSWSPRRVASVLKRYGLSTSKSNGEKLYAKVTEADMTRIEKNYGLDLGEEDDGRGI